MMGFTSTLSYFKLKALYTLISIPDLLQVVKYFIKTVWLKNSGLLMLSFLRDFLKPTIVPLDIVMGAFPISCTEIITVGPVSQTGFYNVTIPNWHSEQGPFGKRALQLWCLYKKLRMLPWQCPTVQSVAWGSPLRKRALTQNFFIQPF